MSKLDDLIKELCPNGVEFKEIPELFFTRNGYTPAKQNLSFWENGTIPWFRMEDIRENGRILADSSQHVSESAVKGKVFPADSIIVATSATIGEHALITVPSIANQRFTYLVLKEQYRNDFNIMFLFYYCFKLDTYCKENLNQGNFASVDMKKFVKFKFPVPPLPVQTEIVRILDEYAKYTKKLTDALTAELAARKQQYSYYRERLLSQSEIEREFLKIEDVCENISSGGTPQSGNSDYYGGNIPWLRTQEVDWREIYDTEIKITKAGLEQSSAKWIPENCVIVAMYGATAAKVAINKIPLTTNQACCNLQIDSRKANYRYVFHWLSSKYEELKALGQGSQSNINAKTVRNFPILVPSLDVQNRIVEVLDNFDTICSDLNIGLPAEIEARQKQYEYYRDALLTYAATGKIIKQYSTVQYSTVQRL